MIASKLVESWLDNQGERQYQPAFVQLLIAEGWRILHNTRHSPLEFGKDVVARDPQGQLYAIQLKGNPGTRLTKNQAQTLLPQFLEGMGTFVPHSLRRTSDERHIFVLCTNGDIDEEARVLLENASEASQNPLSPAKAVELWTRGDLVRRLSTQLDNIWPASIEGVAATLELYTHRGDETPTPQEVAIPINAALDIKGKVTSSQKDATLTSALVMTEIIKKPWYATGDHFSLFMISILAASACGIYADSRKRKEIIQNYSAIALDHASDLIEECQTLNFKPGEVWAQHNMLAEFDIMGERLARISLCASAIVLSGRTIDARSKEFVRSVLDESFFPGCMWGQGSIPSLIARLWALRRVDATLKPERSMIFLLMSVIGAAKIKGPSSNLANASPYFKFEEVLYLLTNGKVGEDSHILEDSSSGRSAFALPLFYMVAKRNWKQTCKALWRPLSNILHERVEIPDTNFLNPKLSDEGRNETIQLYSANWSSMVNQAIDEGDWSYGQRFADFPWLLAMYLALVPYRASPRVLLYLDSVLGKTWYNIGHRPK